MADIIDQVALIILKLMMTILCLTFDFLSIEKLKKEE